jgi:protein involved in polysaccharide export with SLBB domain
MVVAIAWSRLAHAQDEPESDLGPQPVLTEKPPSSNAESRLAQDREALKRSLQANSQLILPGAVDPDTYRLGPGDELQVSIRGGLARNLTLAVGPEGTVLLPTSGTLMVNGLTLRQARAEIMTRLKPEFHGVNIDVRLLQPRRFMVYLSGQVKSPGPIDASGTSRVGDLVLLADPMPDASLRQIDVMHRDGTREKADLELFLRTASQELNPWLHDGDVVNVPLATRFIYIEGAVARPQRYELGPRDSLRTLLALAGGLLPAADSTRALLVRWLDGTRADSTWLTLAGIVSGRENPPLRGGDRLYVFFTPQFQAQSEVTVFGQVNRPGVYPIRSGGQRISEVITAAGGFLPGADLAGIRVRRQNRAATETDPELQRLLRLSRHDLTNSEYDVLNTKLAGLREEYRLDWARVQARPDLDVLLVGGDVVQVDRLVNSIRVDGQVRHPGILSFTPGQTLDDYVHASGGFSERAWRGKTRVTRSVTGQTFLARDVQQLDPGDFIWVPEKPDVTLWDQVRSVLTAAAEVATVYLAFHTVGR